MPSFKPVFFILVCFINLIIIIANGDIDLWGKGDVPNKVKRNGFYTNPRF